MSAIARLVSRIAAGISVLLVTLFGSAAYASQPGPDVVSDGIPALAPVAPGTVISTSAPTDYVAWTLSALVAVVLVAAVAVVATALYRRHQFSARRLQIS